MVRTIDKEKPGLSAPEVVEIAKKRGQNITVSVVYSTRHADGQKAKKKPAKVPRKKPTRSRQRVEQVEEKLEADALREFFKSNGNGHAVDSPEVIKLRADLAAEKARAEVLEEALQRG